MRIILYRNIYDNSIETQIPQQILYFGHTMFPEVGNVGAYSDTPKTDLRKQPCSAGFNTRGYIDTPILMLHVK